MLKETQKRRAFLAACASTVLAGCSGTLAGDSNERVECLSSDHTWPMDGYTSARTNRIDPGAQERNLSQIGTDKSRLSQTGVGPGGSVGAPPVVDDSVAYIPGSMRVEARSTETGERLWAIELDDSVTVSPVLACDTLYISATNETFAIDRDDGSELWSTSVGSISGSPVASGQTLYTVEQNVIAIDAETGERRWTVQTDSIPKGIAVKDDVYITVTHDDTSELISTTRTGEIRWRTTIPEEVFAAPTVTESIVYVVSRTGKLIAVAADDGDIEWQADIEPGVSRHPAVANGYVVVGAGNGERTMAFDATTGERLWTFETGISAGAPVITRESVLTTGANTGIHLLDTSTGERTRHWKLNGVSSDPVVAQGSLLYRDGLVSEIFILR